MEKGELILIPRYLKLKLHDFRRNTLIGEDKEAGLFYKIEVNVSPKQNNDIKAEYKIIKHLNDAGCKSTPIAYDIGTMSKEEIIKLTEAEEEKKYIKSLNKEKFNFIIQEYIPHEESYTLPDILLPLIEQKNLGVYHGDIKPKNIRFDPLRNACVLIDYDQSIFLTETGKNADINSFLVFCDAYDKEKYQQGSWLRHFKEFENKDIPQYLNSAGLVHNPHFSTLRPQRTGDNAIEKICTTLKNEGTNLSSLKALDFFAREGDWQTKYYANKVKQVHAWEIEKNFEEKLRHNLPQNAKITMGNSFELILECDEKFDLVSIDNPQGVFGDEKQYCEHFEALPLIIRVLKKESIIILNVKTRPYNYLTQTDWQKKRNQFYKLEDCSNIKNSFIKPFYEKLLLSYGYLTKYSFLNSRLQENNLYALTMVVEKNE